MLSSFLPPRLVLPLWVGTTLWLSAASATSAPAAPKYSYRSIIASPSTVWVGAMVSGLNSTSGAVTVTGGSSVAALEAFTWNWGDGTTSSSYFPATHTYADVTRNYFGIVTGKHAGGVTTSGSFVVHFVAPGLADHTFDPGLTTSVPGTMPALIDTRTDAVTTLKGSEAFATFPYLYDRTVAERITSAFAAIEYDLVNRNLYRYAGSFNQVALHGVTYEGGSSFWYTANPTFGVGDGFLSATRVGWGTFAHEMGHGFTLNSPATYRMGGRTDGNGSGVLTETLARIFEYVTCSLLANNAAAYGIPDDVAAEIFATEAEKFRGSLKTSAFQIAQGLTKPSGWNDPATSVDETAATFDALTWKFFESTDWDGADYRTATKRLMWFLQHWSPSWNARFDATNGATTASTFRITLMSAAVAYGVGKDLRADFAAWGFPIDITVWNELMATVGDYPGDDTPNSVLHNLSTRARVGTGDQTFVSGLVIAGGPKRVLIRAIGPTLTSFAVDGALAAPKLAVFSGSSTIAENTGWSTAANATDIAAAASAVGAFPLPAGSADCAVVLDLNPGAYTAQITGVGGAAGVAMVEVYEVSGPGRLINISTRAQALTDADTLIPGFVVTGTRPKNLLIRCAGPALTTFGIAGVLAKPSMQLVKGQSVIGANTGWSTANNPAEIAAASRSVQAFAYPSNTADSALFVTVDPGVYSVLTSGADGHTGVAIVEVYDVDQ
jgi:hypothetical protein